MLGLSEDDATPLPVLSGVEGLPEDNGVGFGWSLVIASAPEVYRVSRSIPSISDVSVLPSPDRASRSGRPSTQWYWGHRVTSVNTCRNRRRYRVINYAQQDIG